MHKMTLGLLAACLFSATVLPAEVVIRPIDGPLPERDLTLPRASPDDQNAIVRTFDKVEYPTDHYFLPFIKIDPNAADGDFTLLAIRNEEAVINTVTVTFFEAEAPPTVVRTVSNALLPKEVWTLNLRSEASALSVGSDGFQRGVARIQSDTGTFTADYFQLDPANDFASGSRPMDLFRGELCNRATARFLVGGGFTGGTKLFFFFNAPQGFPEGFTKNIPPPPIPPSAIVTVYREDSTLVGGAEIFSDTYTLEIDAAELIAFIGEDVNFGSIDFDFGNSLGGYVHAEYRANDRFSVSVKGACLDSLP